MSGFIKNAQGAWKQIRQILVKRNGAWAPVRRAYIKQGGKWKQYYGNLSLTVNALGLNQNLVAQANRGLQINGKQAFTDQRSYNVIQFDKYGNLQAAQGFDVYGTSSAGTNDHSAATALANFLNTLPAGQLFAVVTFDEPMADHTYSSLLTAMYRVGATSAIFGGTMYSRGAYLLLGQVGKPATFEFYRGADSSANGGDGNGDPNAAIVLTFSVYNNAFVNVVRTI